MEKGGASDRRGGALRARLAVFPSHFWLLEENGQLLAYANGMVSLQPRITDDLYAEPRACLKNSNVSSSEGFWPLASNFDPGILADCKEKLRRPGGKRPAGWAC